MSTPVPCLQPGGPVTSSLKTKHTVFLVLSVTYQAPFVPVLELPAQVPRIEHIGLGSLVLYHLYEFVTG